MKQGSYNDLQDWDEKIYCLNSSMLIGILMTCVG